MIEIDGKEFNLKSAEFMGLHVICGLKTGAVSCEAEDSSCRDFNPYTDANDRNKVIEKMRINSDFDFCEELWSCYQMCYEKTSNYVEDKSMESAQVKCIWAALNHE